MLFRSLFRKPAILPSLHFGSYKGIIIADTHMHICLSKSYFRHFTGFADLLNKQVINTYVKKPPCTCTSWYTCLCSRSSYSFFFLMYSYVFPLSFSFHTFLIGLICFELYSGICRLSTLSFKKSPSIRLQSGKGPGLRTFSISSFLQLHCHLVVII